MQHKSFNLTAKHLALFLNKFDVTEAVVSPGSRNAPLIHEISQQKNIRCHSIIDERCAGFFALGMAVSLQKPVAICCTSGTAVLNLSPAIAEAYYQNVPLIIVTADRPAELINQLENQAINQVDVYQNFCKYSVALECDETEKALAANDLMIQKALRAAVENLKGPVHINVPLREPLYQTIETSEPELKNLPYDNGNTKIDSDLIETLRQKWLAAKNKLVLGGFAPQNSALDLTLTELMKDSSVVFMADHISNSGARHISQADACLSLMRESEKYAPEIVVSYGGGILSKRVRAFLRATTKTKHWHIGFQPNIINTFGKHEHQVACTPDDFFSKMPVNTNGESSYQANWFLLQQKAGAHLHAFADRAEWSDFKVMQVLLPSIPRACNLFLGNSSVVRYAQIFPLPNKGVTYFANRGTSGIDGQNSTASGIATASDKLTICISGDLAFMYDSNALWNAHLSNKLRFVVINNGSGNIFDLIEGPSLVNQFDKLIATRNEMRFEQIAKQFGLQYFFAADEISLQKHLEHFYEEKNDACVLEIKTDSRTNAEVFKQYFTELKQA